jgi:hypothetical protein
MREMLYTNQNMSMNRTGPIPLSPRRNSNNPLSLETLIEVRYLMPWVCESICAGQATLGECQTEQNHVRR